MFEMIAKNARCYTVKEDRGGRYGANKTVRLFVGGQIDHIAKEELEDTNKTAIGLGNRKIKELQRIFEIDHRISQTTQKKNSVVRTGIAKEDGTYKLVSPIGDRRNLDGFLFKFDFVIPIEGIHGKVLPISDGIKCLGVGKHTFRASGRSVEIPLYFMPINSMAVVVLTTHDNEEKRFVLFTTANDAYIDSEESYKEMYPYQWRTFVKGVS